MSRKLWDPKVTRRDFIKSGIAGAAAVGVAGFPQDLMAKEKVLVVQTWGGGIRKVMKEAWFEPFTKETGIKIYTADATSGINSMVKAQVMSNNVEWDMVSGIGIFSVISLLKDDLIEPIDYSIVDNTDLYKDSLHPYAVPCWVISDGLVYNKSKFTNKPGPQNWNDFWDVKKFPEPRMLGGVDSTAVADNIVYALLAAGVPADKIIPYNENLAYASMDKIKPHIRAWWTSGSHSQQLFTDEEIHMGSMWNGRAVQLQQRGLPIEIVWKDATLAYDNWAVVKNAPHKKEAMELLNFCCQPKQQYEFTKKMFYGPINVKAFDMMDEDFAKLINTYPPNREQHFLRSQADFDWLGENLDPLMERWQTWITG